MPNLAAIGGKVVPLFLLRPVHGAESNEPEAETTGRVIVVSVCLRMVIAAPRPRERPDQACLISPDSHIATEIIVGALDGRILARERAGVRSANDLLVYDADR